ncbi:hypothetical protein [Citrobacter portucalensis]|uniref:hypothetical protein n=1 Tax=Citrobacter portucalensis TaxID=1639133 RepID=UPI0040331798
MQVIIFQERDGVAIMAVMPDTGLEIHEVGKRDVPSGVPFWIVDATDLPVDEPTEAWEIDMENMGAPDGIGGTYVEKSQGEVG